MVDVAALLVRIGGEATGYLSMIGNVKSQTSQTFGVMRGVARGAASELTDVMGLKLPAAAQQLRLALEYVAVGATQMGDKLTWTTNVSKFAGAQLASHAEGAYRLGTAIGTVIRPWVEEVTGLAEATSGLADVNREWVGTLEASEERYQTQLEVYDALRTRLGLLGAEWQVSSQRTHENAVRLATLTREVERHGRQLVTTTQLQREANTVSLSADQIARRLRDAIATQDAALKGTAQSLEEMYGVMDREDATRAMERLLNDFALLADQGIDNEQLMEAFGDKVSEVGQKAEQLGMQLPEPFERLQKAMKSYGEGWTFYLDEVKDYLTGMIPEAADKAAATLLSSLGGSLRTAQGDLNTLGKTLSDMAGQSFEVTVAVKANWEQFDREAAQRGLEPNTAGRVP